MELSQAIDQRDLVRISITIPFKSVYLLMSDVSSNKHCINVKINFINSLNGDTAILYSCQPDELK
jgi:hypothetical protein